MTMASPMTIRDDSSVAALLAELTALAEGSVTVGFHADQDADRDEDAVTNASIAALHEFGGPETERRPFLGPALDKGAGLLGDLQARLVDGVLAGKMPAEAALGLLGEAGVALVREEIKSGVEPPLAPATAAAKGSTAVLVDTGQMLGAVSFEVHLLTIGGSDA
jgi:hypothetical protein